MIFDDHGHGNFANIHYPEATGALKKDAGKADLTHVSYELVTLLARVREFGSKKYTRGDWTKGFKVTRSCAAAMRHIFQFMAGETYDSESGLLHLGHAVASLEHAIMDMTHRPENDDRDKRDMGPKEPPRQEPGKVS